MPLNRIIYDDLDALKAKPKGYASAMSFPYRRGDLVKVDCAQRRSGGRAELHRPQGIRRIPRAPPV